MGGAFVGDPYQSALYRNPGHSITLKLVGTHSNRAAFGARLDLTIHESAPAPPGSTASHSGTSSPATTRHIYRTVGAVSSFGASPFAQHIGLGAASEVDELRIRWPADPTHEQIFRNLAADQTLRLTEGNPTPDPIPTHPFTLGQTRLHPDAPTHQSMP